jgi:hypothetical protein
VETMNLCVASGLATHVAAGIGEAFPRFEQIMASSQFNLLQAFLS